GTRAIAHPSRARSTIGARLSRVWRNWFAMVGRSPAARPRSPPPPRRSSPGSRRRNLAWGRGGSKRAAALLEQLSELVVIASECLEIAGREGGVGLGGEMARFLPPPGERGVRHEPVAASGQETPQGGPRRRALAAPLAPGEEHGVDAGRR